MRWFDGKINSVKNSLIPYVLHGINEEIYDEIIERDDGYYLIVRCGTMPFTNVHNFSDFKTDGNTIIYPLPASEIKEIKLNWTPPTLFGDNSTIVINSGAVTPEFSGEVQTDRRYKEYRKHISGSSFKIDTTNIDFSRKAYIEEVIGTEEGLGDLLVDAEGNPILDEQGNEQYKIEIKNIGKNVFDLINFLKDTSWSNDAYAKTEKIKLSPNTTYCLSFDEFIVAPMDYIILSLRIPRENDGEEGRGLVFYSNQGNSNPHSIKNVKVVFTTGESGEIYFDCYSLQTHKRDIYKYFTDGKLQIEQGDEATEFEPYKESVATLISPKRLFADEKLSWNSARERYEVIPVFKESEPVKDRLIAWLDGRDGGYENYIWKDRSGNGNNMDITQLQEYIYWDGSSYIIKPGSQNLLSSAIETNCPDGYTIEIDFEADFGFGNIRVFGGSQYIETDTNQNIFPIQPRLYYVNKDVKKQIDVKISKKRMCVTYSVSPDSLSIYIDGQNVVQETGDDFTFTPEATFFIGNNEENYEYVRINSIRIYEKQLSDKEVVTNYKYNKSINRDGTITLPCSEPMPVSEGMIAWLDARDNNGTTKDVWVDRTGRGHDFDVLNLAHNSTNGWVDYKLHLNESNRNIVKCKKPITFHSMMIYMDDDLNTGAYLIDGRHNVANSYAGFQNDIYLMNAYKRVVYGDGTYTEGGKNLHVKRNQSVYYVECAQLTTFSQLHLFGRYTADSGFLSCRVKSIMFYDRPLTDEEIHENKIHYNSVLAWAGQGNSTKDSSMTMRANLLPTQNKAELVIFSNESYINTEGNVIIDIPYKEVRYLEYPRDVVATVSYNTDLVTLDWTAVTGATSYKILLDGEEYSQASSNHWETREEIKGLLSVKAINDLTESKVSESIYVMSVPNETFISYFKNEYNNGYSFEVHFPDRSDMETSYKVYYKVDDRQEQCDILPASGVIGTVIKHKFTVPIVLDRIRIRVVAVNDTGENETVPPTTLYITPTPKWTYKDDSKTVLLSWENRFENVTRYNLKIKVNNVVQDEVNVETDGVEVGAKISYNYPLAENDELKVSIAAVMDDIYHIYSEEITASKALDNTLMPPSDFKFRKITDTQIEFSWYDEHTCEEGFELTYSVSNKEPETVFIPTLSMTGTGRKHSYIFNFEEHGFVTAKVRMKWELGVSRYTDEVLVYYLPITGEPPSYLRREVLDGNVRLEWEGQQYVDKYQVYKTIGTEDADTNVEIIDCIENNCNVYINYNYDKNQYNAHEIDNRWKVCKYSKEKYLKNKDRGKHWIEGLEPLIVDYKPSNATGLHFGWGTDFIAHAETYVYLENPAQISFNVFTDDEGCVFVNDKKVLETVNGRWDSLTANLNKGWNRIEILVHQSAGGHSINLSRAINSFVEISGIASNFIPKPMKVEFSVVTKFLDGTVSEKSKPIIFYPQYKELDLNTEVKNPINIVKEINTGVYTKVSSEFDIESKSLNSDERKYLVHQKTIGKHLISPNDVSMTITGKDIETPYNVDTILINANSRQSEHRVSTVSTKNTLLENLIYSTLYTRVQKDYLVYTETNRVRIVTIGDSITAGHPGHWAETMTGDERSQYQYWLNIRLKGQFEIINKGYGSDTTDDMLARFDKDALGYNASYCIIQGGTNDLYWAMAEASGDKSYLDAKVEQMKNNIIQMVRKCWDNGITPIIGTLIPRTGATGIYKDALYEYNQWIIDYCLGNDNIFYIDFFNAGKEKIPPTPLEDPANPGALNPIYDGDAIYDEFGNLIKQGRGIHPNWEGYRIMGECIPLNIFKTGETGLKLYLDADCTIEEEYNDDDKVNPFYRIDIDGVRRKVTKKIVRYVKNVGNNQNLFVAYSYDNYNIDVKFLDANGRRMDYANGLLPASAVARIEMVFDVYDKDSKASVNLYLASREFKVG